MKKIITAIGSPQINEILKRNSKYLVMVPDVQFEEDLIDVLRTKEDAEILILNIELIKKDNINDYINKIKEINSLIKIILITEEKNKEIEETMLVCGIQDVFYGNEINIFQLERAIEKEKTSEEILKDEINSLKKIILKENKLKNNKIKNNILKMKDKMFCKKINKENKISTVISIIGCAGVGKSIFCSNFSLAIKNKKILIIDFDILNKSIKTIFGVKEKIAEEKEFWDNNKLEKIVIKISNNIDLISGIDIIFEDGLKVEKKKVIKLLDNLKNNYEFIIIDTSSECFMDYTKEIIEYSDFSILLVEANLIELKKSKKILDIYINNWKINKEKINILFNKYNKNSIDNEILKCLFNDFNILGYLKANENYNYIINTNTNYIDKNVREEYEKIINKINKKEENLWNV